MKSAKKGIQFIVFIVLLVELETTQINLNANPTCKDLQPDCREETAKCFKKQFRSQMFQHCRKTCRLCVPPGFDNYFRNDESLERINQTRDIPLKPNVLARPKRQIETAAKCGDLGPDCLVYTNYCTNQYYIGFMMAHCPLSCGFCRTNFAKNEVGASVTGSSCKDVVEECEELGRIGFCESDEQSTEIKRTLCAATCKLCLRISVATFNNSTGSFTIGKPSANVVANDISSSEAVRPQPVVIVGKRVQPATNDNRLCIDKDANVCRKIEEKCSDKDFFDYLVVFCPATCALCGQRRKRTSVIPLIRDRALQFIRRQKAGDEPKAIRGCNDRYEKCDNLVSTNRFCENTSGRFLCKATCGYCRPLSTPVTVSEETDPKQTSTAKSAEETETTDVSVVVDESTSDSKSEEPKFTEIIFPRGKGNRKLRVLRIPKQFSDKENDEDDLEEKLLKRRSKDLVDIDGSLGDATIEELLAVYKAKEAKQELEEEAAGLPQSLRRLLARTRNRHRLPLLNNVLALRRRRLINHLVNAQGRFVNGSFLVGTHTSSSSSSPESTENSNENVEETVELALTDSLEELFTSSEVSSDENSEETTEKDSLRPVIEVTPPEKQGEPKFLTKNEGKTAKPKRGTIILINNGIQTVENARVKPKKNVNESHDNNVSAETSTSKIYITDKTKSKAPQKKANRPVRVILKRKLGVDASVQVVNRVSRQPPSRRRHDSPRTDSLTKASSRIRKKAISSKQVKAAKTQSKARKVKNSAGVRPPPSKENEKKNRKNKIKSSEKPKIKRKNKTETSKNIEKGQSTKKKNKRRDSSGRKRVVGVRQNSQLAPKVDLQKTSKKVQEEKIEEQTEPTPLSQNSQGAPKLVFREPLINKNKEITNRIQTESFLDFQKQTSNHEKVSGNDTGFEPAEQHMAQSSQLAPHQSNLLTSIEQADQIIPSLNIPQNQTNLFAGSEIVDSTVKRHKRDISSGKIDRGTKESAKRTADPKENWLKKQFEIGSKEGAQLQSADNSENLLSTAISSIQVVQPYPKRRFTLNKKNETENEKRAKRSLGKNSKESNKSVKAEKLSSTLKAENKSDSNSLPDDSESGEKQEPIITQIKVVEPKENWLKKQFELKSKDESTSTSKWEENQIGSGDEDSESFESSLFPVLQKAPWRPRAYQLHEIISNRNLTAP